MVSHAGFVVSHADFRGFTRARFVVSHAPLIKGLTWYLTFLTRLLRFAVGITTAPQRGVEEPPACASRHACLRRGAAANTDSETSNNRTSGWTRRRQNSRYRFATCLRHKHPSPRMRQERAETARQGMARGELRGRVLVGALRL